MKKTLSGLLSNFTPFKSWIGELKNINTLKADAIAGITGAIIVLPQGIAFATIAGLPPEYGLYTAMITPIIAAIFGSSMHLISGPTTAISLVIFSTIGAYADPGSVDFIRLTLSLTFLAGLYQFLFGFLKLGKVVDFVSHTVVIAFTAGASILIVTSQLKSLLGISLKSTEFIEVWIEMFKNITQINIYSLSIGFLTFIIAFALRKMYPKMPNLLIALVSGSIFAALLQGDLHSVKFVPEIPRHLPPLSFPDLSFKTIEELAPGAFAIAVLGLIEAISISRSIASKSHQLINANQEFIGQGLSNIVGSFFSSYAGTGSFTRSGVNYSAGAKTPMSAIFASIFLALIVLLIAPITRYLPIPAMAGVIVLVGYNLINFSQIKKIIATSKKETAILIVTFLSTLFLELEYAIYLGIILSLVLFLNKTSRPKIVTLYSSFHTQKNKKVFLSANAIDPTKIPQLQCPQIKIIRIDMSIYFGSVNYIQETLMNILKKEGIKNIIIIGSGVNMIDMNGREMLEEISHMFQKAGGGLFFLEFKNDVFKTLETKGFIKNIGEEYFFASKNSAIQYIFKNKIDKNICKNCTKKAFIECGADAFGDYTKKS
ncbi:MAG: SulP family inorganic anion transporter [Candidatus Gracilibacteria bacterium]